MSELLNYVLTLALIFFTLSIFLSYRSSKKEGNASNSLFAEKIFIYLSCILGHGFLVYSNDFSLVHMKVFVLSMIAVVSITFLSHYVYFLEPVLWHIIAMLHLTGTLILHRLNTELAMKQNLYGLIGFVAICFIGLFINKFKYLDKLTWLYIVLSIGLLLIANKSQYGAKNWFELGGISFQPSEFVKIIFAFHLASVFNRKYNFINLVLGSVVSFVLILILVYQRDLGSALLFFALYMVLSYMYSQKRVLTLLQVSALLGGSLIAYQLFSHVRVRVLAWIDPFTYIDNQGYQITQSLFAISNGKWLGAGLGSGMPKQVPVVTSDFIYAAIAEELGSVYAIFLLLLFLFMIIIMISQSQKTNDTFKAYVGAGITTMLGFQGFLIVGGVIKLLPLTGVTLPFISYGGTSLISSMLMVGTVEAISKSKNRHLKKMYRTHTLLSLKLIMTGIYSVLISFFLVFLLFQSDTLELNSANKRLEVIKDGIQRGSIFSNDGLVLAYTEEKDGKLERHYPYNEMFSHVIGYSQIGSTGLEKYLEVELLNGHYHFLNMLKNNILGTRKEGSDLMTTLDVDLQKIAYESLEGKKGAVIAIEPSTGKILAMVSKPDYDPNEIQSIFDTIINDSENAPLLNRATNGVYPPGSTFKMLTALAYLHEHGDNFDYFCKGSDIFSDKVINCYGNTAHGRVDLKTAFAESCNTAFAKMGEEIRLSTLQELCNQVLFNTELPYDYGYKSSSFILLEQISDELMAETVIGQGETL
ncbi:MAG: FtsW/RodA/SpoVE family cell cycle protein, partial [Vallitaleaceae bacterium]|nr:FtsW/RodA/SpoVE family cell cycle protein [Vallitaleaceae bacterium]